MRGSRVEDYGNKHWNGIIPAHAGLTARDQKERIQVWDHPRACGAHPFAVSLSRSAAGSSPRMRGSLEEALRRVRKLGIIPAHAGLTLMRLRLYRSKRDHPRACGAHFCTVTRTLLFSGSSPRMRGSRNYTVKLFEDAGLTLKNPNIDAILSGPHPVFYSVLRVIR